MTVYRIALYSMIFSDVKAVASPAIGLRGSNLPKKLAQAHPNATDNTKAKKPILLPKFHAINSQSSQ